MIDEHDLTSTPEMQPLYLELAKKLLEQLDQPLPD